VNWVNETIRRIARKRALERWKTNTENCEITLQTIWPTTKFLTTRGGPKATTAIHGTLGPVFYLYEETNVIENYLENLSRCTMCVTLTMNGGWRLESQLC
jgi:hypothetical protein